MDYYLPTTLKLLNAYDRMGAQGVSGENIDATMQRVESMMGTIVTAFEKQLDMLFGSEAMDISADITVLENMMKREGSVRTTVSCMPSPARRPPGRTISSSSCKGVSDAKESDGVQRQSQCVDIETAERRVARPDLLCNLCIMCVASIIGAMHLHRDTLYYSALIWALATLLCLRRIQYILEACRHQFFLDLRNNHCRILHAGHYLALIAQPDFTAVRKLVTNLCCIKIEAEHYRRYSILIKLFNSQPTDRPGLCLPELR